MHPGLGPGLRRAAPCVITGSPALCPRAALSAGNRIIAVLPGLPAAQLLRLTWIDGAASIGIALMLAVSAMLLARERMARTRWWPRSARSSRTA